ncbi:MAG: glucans biosynthesis glucosyltransferase MdoH, partial [Ignavibacteria bacterium]
MPALHRSPMAPQAWPPGFAWRRARNAAAAAPSGTAAVARRRRAVLTVLTLGAAVAATWAMASVLPYHGRRVLELIVLALFAVLFLWVSAGFWTALMGFVVLLSGGDRHAVSASAPPDAPLEPAARAAVIMPICNEDVARVFAGLRATFESAARTADGGRFDFFVLSDTNDPDLRAEEVAAWYRLCRAVGFGRVYYRWRRHRIKRKSGNVADFCRRWGRDYRYMVVLDADSVMSGECLARLLRLMEANPRAGIIQTAPRAAGRETLHARIQQFAGRVYGPLFTAGLHYWQLGEAHYWGHNAIIRVEPFMRHCALGRLPRRGRAPVEVLSHDFVEAALMRRAGWSVWIAYDLPGSYEEMPPNLLDELQRDRRWSQGNLINARLLLAEGLHAVHRAVFAIGVMAYLSSPLWFLFLLLSTALAAIHALVPPQYFTQPYQLFPDWPEWHQAWAVLLFGATSTLLFAPKFLSVALLWRQGARGFGGVARLLGGVLLESLYSMALAPIRMLFHTQFVFATVLGWHAGWKSPPRSDAATGWTEALRRHGWHGALGGVWAVLVYWIDAAYLWWLLPVIVPLLLAVPLSVFGSRVSLGRRARAAGWFTIPEETAPPPELLRLREELRCAHPAGDFAAALVDPQFSMVAAAAASWRTRSRGHADAARRARVA